MSSPLAVPAELVRDAIAKIDSDGLLHPVTETMREWVAKVAAGPARVPPALLSLKQLPIDDGERVMLAAGEPVGMSLSWGEWQLRKVVSDDADWLVVIDVASDARRRSAELEAARCRSLGRMAGTLVHNLNNQCNSALALSALVHDSVLAEADRAALRELEIGTKAGARMATSLAKLLVRRRPNRERFSPAEILEDALSIVSHSLQLVGASLQVDIAPDMPAVRGTAIEVMQSVMSGLIAFEHVGATTIRCVMTREPVAIAGGRVRDCVVLRCHAGPWVEQTMARLLAVIGGEPNMLSGVVSNPDVLGAVGNAVFAQRCMGGDLSADRVDEALQLTYVWPTVS